MGDQSAADKADDEWTEFGTEGDPDKAPLPNQRRSEGPLINITIQGVCEFTWSPAPEHLAVLTKLSGLHYDGVCRAASAHGGFIYGWTMLAECKEPGDDELRCRGSFRDFDICLKIMEGASYACDAVELVHVREMRDTFHKMLRRANELYAIWREELS